MMKSNYKLLIFILNIFILFAGCENKLETGTDKQKFIENLKTAFSEETSASVKYLAYSKKAGEEGLGNVAKLFEAASKSEGILAKNFKELLEKSGDKAPEVKPEFAVKTTKENIDEAVKSGINKTVEIYPDYKKLSDILGEYGKEASKSYDFALRTIPKFKVYFEEALKSIDLKSTDKLASVYWVCPVCGNTVVSDKDTSKCSICKNEKEPWIKM